MKKYISLVCLFACSFLLIQPVSAQKIIKGKETKQIVISSNAIKKLYGERTGNKIVQKFENVIVQMRIKKQKAKLENIKATTKKGIVRLNKKAFHTTAEKRALALLSNLYFRADVALHFIK